MIGVYIPPKIDANFISNFVTAFLWDDYDKPTPLVQFHWDAWELVCLSDKKVGLAAPRGHSKTTSVTFAYVLVNVLFRAREFPVLVGNTYDSAVKFLATIRETLLYNEKINSTFGINPVALWDKDSENEIIVTTASGHKFCIHATGIEQYSRGIKWIHKRPDLIMLDDVEDDELVLSKERRDKLEMRFLSTVEPSGADNVIFRMVGTILHMDSLLQHVLDDPTWTTRVWEAHDDNFENILWPEKFSKQKLIEIRNGYIQRGKLENYNMEYRNKPVDTSSGFFRKSDFRDLTDDDWAEIQSGRCTFIGAADFAWTQKQKSDYTVLGIAAVNSIGDLLILDVVRGRFDGRQQEENIFSLEFTYRQINGDVPVQWFPEEGAIFKTLLVSLEKEMIRRDCYLSFTSISPGTKDKKHRATPFQTRARSRKVRCNMKAEWYPAFELELLQFDRGLHDDQVDMCALFGLGLSQIVLPSSNEEFEEENYVFKRRETNINGGRSKVTGY
jgi:phage terminase large subunit-like protein